MFAFFIVHLFLILGILCFALIAALFIYAWRKHESVKAALLNVELYGSKFETGLLAKIHALENGGHLTAGTTQKLIVSQTATPKAAS